MNRVWTVVLPASQPHYTSTHSVQLKGAQTRIVSNKTKKIITETIGIEPTLCTNVSIKFVGPLERT